MAVRKCFSIILIIVGIAVELMGLFSHDSWGKPVGTGFLKFFADIGGMFLIIFGLFLMFR